VRDHIRRDGWRAAFLAIAEKAKADADLQSPRVIYPRRDDRLHSISPRIRQWWITRKLA